jgi:linoleate 10R-lipoxygenase
VLSEHIADVRIQDPRLSVREGATPEKSESGVGNQVSFEFCMAYRWHSCIGAQDEKWTEEAYKHMFGKDAQDVTIPDLLGGLKKWQTEMPEDPADRTFAGLARNADGRFSDEDLVRIMSDATEQVAGP